MEDQLLITQNEEEKQTVNKDVRICIECASSLIHKKNNRVHCKKCGKFFDIKEDTE